MKYANICEDLNESFEKRFHDLSGREKHLSLFKRPFTVKVEEIENAELQLELLDQRTNEDLRDVYQEQSLLQVLFSVAGGNISSSFEKRSFLDSSIWKHIPV